MAKPLKTFRLTTNIANCDNTLMNTYNIGILGGTFNPIHLGHTLPAKAVAKHLALDKVILIPANTPPHKASPNVSASHRATMVKLACKNDDILCCDDTSDSTFDMQVIIVVKLPIKP